MRIHETLYTLLAKNDTTQISIKDLPHLDPSRATLEMILTTVFITLGAISLLIITIAGFKYVVSRGSAQEVAKAKNTIVYALIGLAVATSGEIIVRFVIGGLT